MNKYIAGATIGSSFGLICVIFVNFYWSRSYKRLNAYWAKRYDRLYMAAHFIPLPFEEDRHDNHR